ncbi:MAG: TonB-dependent receptor plug domain-containing protein [Holosporaceae bacterium]|nr:MAG: TonB-dependent receptor plug domain-containing protein [Holosporaceae bacterium]
MRHENFSDTAAPQDTKSNMEKIPGLHLTELGGPGQMTRVSFRGQSSRHTLFKIDGIPLRDASDSIDASSLFSNTLEIANVTPGSGGIFEGSGSTGGTVNMRTPFPKEHLHKTTLMGDSHNTGYVHTMHGTHNDHTSSVIHVDGFNTKGIPQRGPQRMYGERAHAQKDLWGFDASKWATTTFLYTASHGRTQQI